MASMSFVVEGPIDTKITITENADGTLTFDVEAINGGGQTLDYRGLFFDVADGYEGLLTGLTTDNDEITDEKFEANAVDTLGRDANIKGDVVNARGKFDGGVEVGTAGKAADDYDSFSFVLSHDTMDLTLAMFSGVDFGVRATSVGYYGEREGSFKAGGTAPLAPVDDIAYVESGDTVLVDVLGNDDPALDGSTLSVSGDDNGTATVVGGQVQFVADDIGGDNTDDSVQDDMDYSAQSTDGTISVSAEVSVRVIDPLVETDVDSQLTANGQSLSLSMSTEDRTYNTSSFLDIDILSGSLDQTVNVSFVIDGSGSVFLAQYNEEVAAVQNAINTLRADYAGSAATVNVQLVQFSSGSSDASFDLFDAALDDVSTGTPLATYQSGGSTNYEAAFQDAVSFFTGTAGDDNFMFFASDGNANNPSTNPAEYLDEVAVLTGTYGVEITAVGFGGNVTLARLDAIDNTDGAEEVATAAELGDVFSDSALFPADLIEFSLTVDGNDTGLGVGDLNDLGGGDYSLDTSLLGLDNTLGATNTVVATAGFDTDDDGLADTYRTATTIINGTDGTDLAWL